MKTEDTSILIGKFVSENDPIQLAEIIRELNRSCTQGSEVQNVIINFPGFLEKVKNVLFQESNPQRESFYKLLANTIVQNKEGQEKVWNLFGKHIIEWLEGDNTAIANVSWMIVHNISLYSRETLDQQVILTCGLRVIDGNIKAEGQLLPDFLGFYMDYMITDCDGILALYKNLDQDQQMTLLYYILDYVKDESNLEIIEESFMKHLTLEFKKSSDCILKTVTSYVESVKPEKVVTLLEIISTMCGQNKYAVILKKDGSLFLNICLVLQNLQKLGKNSDNIFAPIQKLEALAPASEHDADHEREFSYNFKTMLIKTIANLSYQNKKNQNLAREMEIMMSIFDCTNADARNPLIKEWSILAIKNLCENNVENQKMVRALTKVGDAESPMLREFGIDTGILRIGKK